VLRQGLMLAHLSAQLEPYFTDYTQYMLQKALTLSRKLDEYKPLC